ncbi:hypothetical protein ACWEKJ_39990 [Amycolatopsis thermoflava]
MKSISRSGVIALHAVIWVAAMGVAVSFQRSPWVLTFVGFWATFLLGMSCVFILRRRRRGEDG